MGMGKNSDFCEKRLGGVGEIGGKVDIIVI